MQVGAGVSPSTQRDWLHTQTNISRNVLLIKLEGPVCPHYGVSRLVRVAARCVSVCIYFRLTENFLHTMLVTLQVRVIGVSLLQNKNMESASCLLKNKQANNVPLYTKLLFGNNYF